MKNKCKKCNSELNNAYDLMNENICYKCFNDKYDFNDIFPLSKFKTEYHDFSKSEIILQKKEMIKTLLFLTIFFFVIYISFIILFFCYRDTFNPWLFTIILTLIFCVFEYGRIKGLISLKKELPKLDEQLQEEYRKNRYKLKITVSYNTYLYCTSKGISSAEELQENYKLLYKNGDVNKKIEDFKLGKEIYDYVNNYEDLSGYYEILKIKNLIGVDKYINPLLSKINNNLITIGYLNRATNINNNFKNNNGMNSYVKGGLISGIAGSAMGTLYAVSDASKKESLNNSINSLQKSYNSSIRQHNDQINELNKKIDYWKNQIIEINKTDEIFENMKFDIKLYDYTKYNNIELKLTINFKKDNLLINKPAVVDGTILVEVFNKKEKVGEGLIAPKCNNPEKVSQVGFESDKDYVIKCNMYNKNIEKKNLKFAFKPINLWYIQK